MSKCVKCGSELISNKDEHYNICPTCGMKYITSSTKDVSEITDLSINTVTNNDNSKHNTKSIFYSFNNNSWARTPLIGMIISAIIYCVFKICQYTSSITQVLYIIFDIVQTISIIVFVVSLISYMIYKRIDKYHDYTIAPLQREITELKKEIENLKKEIK